MAAITHRLRYEMLEVRRLMAADLNDSLNVTVDSSSSIGLRAAEIVLKYDPAVLDIEESDIKAGQAWQGQASLISHVDEAEGQVKLFLFSVQELNNHQGDLVELQFDVIDQLASDVAVSLSDLRINEGALNADGQLLINKSDTTVASSDVDQDKTASIKACGPWSEAVVTQSAETLTVQPTGHVANDGFSMAAPMIERIK